MTLPAPRLPVLAAALAVVACLGFALFTGHIWEDYFITFRSSLNLATGHGLVYQPGERVEQCERSFARLDAADAEHR